MTGNPLGTKLGRFVELDAADHAIIADWCWDATDLAANRHYMRQGDRLDLIGVVLSGWACRYKMLADGRRQIVGILLPGDMCDIHGTILKASDHHVMMLSDGVIASVRPQALLEGTDASPRLLRALWWSMLVEVGIAREWLLNIGQRSAVMRMAHLFCELWWRAHMVGLTSGNSFQMPLTQIELGDALGLTSVHVNRMMRDLRARGDVEVLHRTATIADVEALSKWSGFDPDYLQLARRSDLIAPRPASNSTMPSINTANS